MPVTFIFEQIERAVERRKKEREAGDLHSNDFIDLFLDAEAEGLDYIGEGAYNRKGEINVQRKLTTDEVIAQCFVFLLAGFDTTANTLAYISHCLARHPDVQERMREEIDQICTTEEVNYDQLNDLKYMDCVVKEALRLHPPATVAISRVAEKDCEFAGIKLEKGTAIQVDAASIQRDKEIWGEDADEFLPERWMNLTKQQGQAYLAFGGGPRMCVGMRLGYSESKIALVHVLKRYALYIAPESKEALTLRGAITVSPSEVPVRIQSRPLGD